jgi:hypothetical protein
MPPVPGDLVGVGSATPQGVGGNVPRSEPYVEPIVLATTWKRSLVGFLDYAERRVHFASFEIVGIARKKF